MDRRETRVEAEYAGGVVVGEAPTGSRVEDGLERVVAWGLGRNGQS